MEPTPTDAKAAQVTQAIRQSELEAAYTADGRDDKNHPYHALFTGLKTGLDQGPIAEFVANKEPRWTFVPIVETGVEAPLTSTILT